MTGACKECGDKYMISPIFRTYHFTFDLQYEI